MTGRAPARVIAVDWSGDARRAHRRIWLAEAAEPGHLTRLENGRDRAAVTAHLLAQAGRLVIGLDFGFSFPLWYLDQLGVHSTPELWAYVAKHGEAWLARCAPPFWGRAGRPCPAVLGPALRRAERAVPRVNGIAPKSMFQIGGAGAVGTGSIRGMPLLDRLQRAGATIWPFSGGETWPLVLEIYPRLLTGPVRKSDLGARSALLAQRYPNLASEHRSLAVLSEDAFDATVSALVMVERLADLGSLPVEADAALRREGRIWHPAWRLDRP